MQRSLTDIKREVVERRMIKEEHLIGKGHHSHQVQARREVAELARKEGYALIDIGAALGGRHPSTIARLLQKKGNEQQAPTPGVPGE